MEERVTVELGPDEKKQEYIRKYFDDENLLFDATDEEKKLYKEYIKEGVKKNWIIALYALAYGCYGGNEIFKCDWVKSRDTLLKIIELQGDKDPFIYNTLGYIYYYGRCNDGVPEYDLAFKYYSIGAANGVYESIYKLADMFIGGKGVPKSEKAGAKLILDIYDENMENFCNRDYTCKFADIALRMGSLYENGIGVEKNHVDAMYHYNEALYAIGERMEECDYYGDAKVEKSIREAYKRVEESMLTDFFKDEIVIDHPAFIGILLANSRAVDITLLKEDNDYFLVAERYASEDMEECVLMNVPELHYCELVNRVKVKLKDAIVINEDLPQRAFIDTIKRSDEENTWIFCYRDMDMLTVTCSAFVFDPFKYA